MCVIVGLLNCIWPSACCAAEWITEYRLLHEHILFSEIFYLVGWILARHICFHAVCCVLCIVIFLPWVVVIISKFFSESLETVGVRLFKLNEKSNWKTLQHYPNNLECLPQHQQFWNFLRFSSHLLSETSIHINIIGVFNIGPNWFINLTDILRVCYFYVALIIFTLENTIFCEKYNSIIWSPFKYRK